MENPVKESGNLETERVPCWAEMLPCFLQTNTPYQQSPMERDAEGGPTSPHFEDVEASLI